MEIESASAREFDKAHPNYERWRRAREVSHQRGEFVHGVVSNFVECKDLKVLDIGSGEGGTVKIFAKNNFVVSLEKNFARLKKQRKSEFTSLIAGDATALPFKERKFDLIILQDCIEHINMPDNLVGILHHLLAENGILYISTPNRYSVINILSDPHWGLPLLSLFKRRQIEKYFLKFFRKQDYGRPDAAELFSLKDLTDRFSGKFSIILNTKTAFEALLNSGMGLVWSNFHISLLKLLHSFKLERALRGLVNDEPGFINKFITPTFFLILKKR